MEINFQLVHHHGSGIDLLKRQTSPHAHYVGITPDHKYLYSVDLGADKIIMYEFINEKLQETSLSQSVIPGSGPRHMIFSHDGKYLIILLTKLQIVLWFINMKMDTLLDSSYSLCTSSFPWLFKCCCYSYDIKW